MAGVLLHAVAVIYDSLHRMNPRVLAKSLVNWLHGTPNSAGGTCLDMQEQWPVRSTASAVVVTVVVVSLSPLLGAPAGCLVSNRQHRLSKWMKCRCLVISSSDLGFLQDPSLIERIPEARLPTFPSRVPGRCG